MRILFWIALFFAAAQPARSDPSQSLSTAFAAAWARQPAALAEVQRERAAQARRSAADALTPEPPSLELGGRSDRFNRDQGSLEYELGLAVPLWLPGERSGSQALADSETTALGGRGAALRLQLAGELRQAWWEWQLAVNEQALSGQRVTAARKLRDDVARRVAAGDLARADQHQADGALSAALAEQAEATAQFDAARYRVQGLIGQPPVEAGILPESEVADSAAGKLLAEHPLLRELAGRSEVSRRSLDLARARNRANPEVVVGTRRERGSTGEAMAQTWALSLRIPFSSAPRQEAKLAEANADLIEASIGAERERERLVQSATSARSRLAAARAQLAANTERARLAAESRAFFDKSFRLGESDLPTRLRIEQEAFEAERQLSRARINQAQSLSAYRQALGLLPE